MLVDKPFSTRRGVVDDVKIDPLLHRLESADDRVDCRADRQAEGQKADRCHATIALSGRINRHVEQAGFATRFHAKRRRRRRCASCDRAGYGGGPGRILRLIEANRRIWPPRLDIAQRKIVSFLRRGGKTPVRPFFANDVVGIALGSRGFFKSRAIAVGHSRAPRQAEKTRLQYAAREENIFRVSTKLLAVDLLIGKRRREAFDRALVAAEHLLQVASADLGFPREFGGNPVLGGPARMVEERQRGNNAKARRKHGRPVPIDGDPIDQMQTLGPLSGETEPACREVC